jgi:hypothetical protein
MVSYILNKNTRAVDANIQTNTLGDLEFIFTEWPGVVIEFYINILEVLDSNLCQTLTILTGVLIVLLSP